MIREYVYCVKNPMDGSVPCKNPTVVFITGEGQAVPCPDNGDGCITISVPEGVSGCVTGDIICSDCGKCPPKPFEICPCTISSDCKECEKCQQGVCTPICGGLCNNGDCVECINNNDCTLGKVCRDGSCQCPAGKNFVNERGECASCLSNSNCGKCQVCINGECVGKSCEASCDPSTGDCVECINSGHCQGRTDGRNCCKGVKCDCCEGYIFNVALNTCVPIPPCILDIDCNECEICVAGNCQPRVCPDGTICIKDKCVETCDCNNPTCDRVNACVRYNSTTCICSKCAGACTENNNCGDGCYCKDGNCVPNPCNKPCLTGADCGPGCGCKDNTCIPCDSLNCADESCNEIDGCKCYGSTCQGDPCSGPCENGSDCGQGCGCLNGSCVSCDKLPCNICAETLGCNCISGNCVAVPKCNGKCTSSADCPFGCTCYEGNCTSCASFACNECFESEDCQCTGGKCEGKEKDCENQTFTVTKDQCTLKASLSKKSCCNCPEIEVKTSLKEIRTTTSTVLQIPAKDYVYEVSLFRDGVPLETYDYPLSGTIKGEAKYYYILSGIQYEGSTSTTMSFNSATNKLEFVFTLPNKGFTPSILSYSFHFTQITNIEFPNGCTYTFTGNETLTFKQYSNLNIGLTERKIIKSKDCRAPLFTWYRGLNENNVSEQVKKVYALNGGDIWFDNISDCADGFCSNYFYKVKSDCGCVTDSNPLKAMFCPTDLPGVYAMDNVEVNITECGLKFTLLNIFNNCPVNGIIPPTCTKCASSQVDWILKLFDASGLVHTKNLRFNLASEVIGYTYTSTTPLTTVTIEHSQNPECKYTRHLTAGIEVATGLNCDTMVLTVNVGGDAPIAGCTVSLYQGPTTGTPVAIQTTNVLGVASFSGVSPNVEYNIKTACGACQNISTMLVNCCTSEGEDELLVSYNPATSKVTANVLPGSALKTYTYYIDDVIQHTGGSSVLFTEALTNGTYVMKSIDNKGCIAGPTNLVVDNCPNTTISISAIYDSTIGAEQVDITNILGNGIAPFLIQLINSGNTVVREQANVSTFPMSFNVNDLPDGVYQIKATCSQGCIGTTEITLQKGLECSLNPADINASRPFPQLADCSPNVHTKLWVNNANTPYTVETYKDGLLLETEIFEDGGDSPSGNITYSSTLGANDEYDVENLDDGLYTFKVIDDRGCTDEVQVNIACNCLVPITVDTQGIVCNGEEHQLVINSITGGQNPGTYLLQVYQNGICDDGAGGVEVIAELTISSGATLYNIPVANQQTPGDQYSIKVTSGNCATTCITLNAPDCTGVECLTGVEAYWRGEVTCAGSLNTDKFRVKAINNSGITLDYVIYRKANTIVGLCPAGTDCDTTGYTTISSGTLTNGQTACDDTISATPDNTACFLVKFTNPANPACVKCVKPTLKFD